MPFVFKGTTIKKLNYRGTQIKKHIAKGVQIFADGLLFDNGVLNCDYTIDSNYVNNGWHNTQGSSSVSNGLITQSVSGDRGETAFVFEKQDLTSYTQMKVTLKSRSGTGFNPVVGVSTSQNSCYNDTEGTNRCLWIPESTAGTYTIDISGLTGYYYPYLGLHSGTTGGSVAYSKVELI